MKMNGVIRKIMRFSVSAGDKREIQAVKFAKKELNLTACKANIMLLPSFFSLLLQWSRGHLR